MDQARTPGDNVREARKRRGLTQRELAELSGLSVSLIRKLEQGERDDIRIETARKLAVSLQVPTTSLIGGNPEAPSFTSQPDWTPIRQALLSPPASTALEPVTEHGLNDALTTAVRLYHDNRYDLLARILPGLLQDAADATPLLRSRVLQLTGSLMVQTRQRDIARIALDRSLAAAEESGSTLDAASTVITTCWLLLIERKFQEVSTTALHWADLIEPKLSLATTAELSTWGWLLLRASAAGIRDNRPEESAQAMRLAQAAAVAVGRDRGSYHSYWTTFGSATVAMKQVENAVIDEKPDKALALSETVPSNLRPTSDNRNRHLLDVAAARLDLRQYPEGFEVLWRLRQEAPAWLQNQRMAGDLLAKITARRRTLTPEMRELADFVHLAM